MTLEEVRAKIDEIDPKLKELLMKRLDCSYAVAEAKARAHETQIYRADREEEILTRLSEGIPSDRLAGYRSVVRKIMETSRMYQYGLLFDWDPGVFTPLVSGVDIPDMCRRVIAEVTRENHPNAMSSILSMIGDYGFNMERMELTEEDEKARTVTFRLTILGDLNRTDMRKLMFQLSGECLKFRIVECLS